MLKKIILLATALGAMGCVTFPVDQHVEEIVFREGKLQKFSYMDKSYGEKRDSQCFVDAVDTLKTLDPLAIPELEGLPMPSMKKNKPRKYTGIIKNKTGYDLSVPASNSSATLTIPAHGWIEYSAWYDFLKLTVYRDGNPFYCLRIHAHPRQYDYMCNKYDFIAEVVSAEPTPTPSKLKRRIKRKAPKLEVEG